MPAVRPAVTVASCDMMRMASMDAMSAKLRGGGVAAPKACPASRGRSLGDGDLQPEKGEGVGQRHFGSNRDRLRRVYTPTVGKKTVPMFGCFGKTDLA